MKTSLLIFTYQLFSIFSVYSQGVGLSAGFEKYKNQVEKNNLSVERKAFIGSQTSRQQQSLGEYQQILKEYKESDAKNRVDYKTPRQTIELRHYSFANLELLKLFNDSGKIDLKRAVFLVENAFFDNTLSYNDFCLDVNNAVAICKQKMANSKLDYADKLAKIATVKSLFTDTVKIYKGKKLQNIHYPFSYDFFDYMGENDWSKMFVSKLLKSNKGQCHSLPLLFKILSDELGVDTYLSYAPNHTFIKFKDNKGNIYNFETTNGNLVSDSWLMSSGFIKAAAIKNSIYMDTLNSVQVLAHCFVDLGMGYREKQGVDEFTISCAKKALELHPNNIVALTFLADCLTVYCEKERRIAGYPPFREINQYPDLKSAHQAMINCYQKIDNLGYEQMPQEQYREWLNTVEKEQNKQASKDLNKIFIINKN